MRLTNSRQDDPAIRVTVPRTRGNSEQLTELVTGQPGLAQDRAQRPSCQLTVERHDHRPAGIVPKFDVAPPLADLSESSFLQRPDDLSTRDDGKGRAHAGTWTGAMIGGSTPSGKG